MQRLVQSGNARFEEIPILRKLAEQKQVGLLIPGQVSRRKLRMRSHTRTRDATHFW